MQCGWNEFSNTPSFFARQRSWIDHLLHSCLRSSLDEECLLALGEPAALSLSVAYNARRLNKLASTATKIHSISDTTRLTLSIANLIRLGRPKADQLRTYAYCTRSYVMGHSMPADLLGERMEEDIPYLVRSRYGISCKSSLSSPKPILLMQGI
jgi:hypothetical protein